VLIVDPMAREHGELIWAADAGPAGQVRSLKVRKPKQLSLTDQAAQSVSKGMKTKVLFSWKNGQARARFYDYGKPKFKLPDLPREADDIAGLEDDYMDGMDQPDPNLRF